MMARGCVLDVQCSMMGIVLCAPAHSTCVHGLLSCRLPPTWCPLCCVPRPCVHRTAACVVPPSGIIIHLRVSITARPLPPPQVWT
jgi:hypothetical protein